MTAPTITPCAASCGRPYSDGTPGSIRVIDQAGRSWHAECHAAVHPSKPHRPRSYASRWE